jgi:DNA ligase-1
MSTIYPSLFDVDSKGKIREWYMEGNDTSHRTISGIFGGKLTTSKWTDVKQKNVGKSNETSLAQQVILEIEAQYEKKRFKGATEELPDPDTWKSPYFEPMLAEKYKDFLVKKDRSKIAGTICQPKLDGIRCIVSKSGMWSRKGKPFPACPHIYDALAFAFEINPDFVFDGELYNHQFKDDFNELSSMIKTQKPKLEDFAKTAEFVQYHIYDCFTGCSQDIFTDRWRQLNQILEQAPEADTGRFAPLSICAVPTLYIDSEEDLDAEYALFLEDGYEGQMIRFDTPYENKRTWTLLKRKEFIDEEFEIVEVLEGDGNWRGCAKRVWCKMKDGRKFKATPKGTQAYLAEVLAHKDFFVGKLATVRYFALTPDKGDGEGGKPRFGVITELDVQDK